MISKALLIALISSIVLLTSSCFAQCLSWSNIQNLPKLGLRQRDQLLESKSLRLYDDSGVSDRESTGWCNSARTALIRLIAEDKGGYGIEYQFTNAECYESLYNQIASSGVKKGCETSFSGGIGYAWTSVDGKQMITLFKGSGKRAEKDYTVYVLLLMKLTKPLVCD